MGASVGVGLGVGEGCIWVPAADVLLLNGTKGSYVGKTTGVAGRGLQAEKQIDESIKAGVRLDKRMGMGAIVPNVQILGALRVTSLQKGLFNAKPQSREEFLRLSL